MALGSGADLKPRVVRWTSLSSARCVSAAPGIFTTHPTLSLPSQQRKRNDCIHSPSADFSFPLHNPLESVRYETFLLFWEEGDWNSADGWRANRKILQGSLTSLSPSVLIFSLFLHTLFFWIFLRGVYIFVFFPVISPPLFSLFAIWRRKGGIMFMRDVSVDFSSSSSSPSSSSSSRSI